MSQEPPSLSYILDVACSDDCMEAPDKAKVYIDQETFNLIKKAMKAVADLGAASIRFYSDVEALYDIDYDAEEETLIDKTDEYRVESLEMVVIQFEVFWRGTLRHSTSSWKIESILIEELLENWKVVSTKEKDVPLLINELEYDSSRKLFKERLKGEVNV